MSTAVNIEQSDTTGPPQRPTLLHRILQNKKKIAFILLLVLPVLLLIALIALIFACFHTVSDTPQSYDNTYPLTKPVESSSGKVFRIGAISDLDTKSKISEYVWIAYFMKGHLTWDPSTDKVTVKWDESNVTLKSTIGEAGRGMELSELVTFNGKLYAPDDRTGIIYELRGNEALPWVILMDGDGTKVKGFKGEWATVKDEKLYVGGFGFEWVDSKGRVLHYNPQWIKVITPKGEVSHIYWRDKYMAVLKGLGYSYPGYAIHEAVVWSSILNRWCFLPRKVSHDKYVDYLDELRGTNLLIKVDPTFTDIKTTEVGKIVPKHGFSTFKFIPGSDDRVIVAVKSEEVHGVFASYIMAFTIDGKILLPETKFTDAKIEGLEFI